MVCSRTEETTKYYVSVIDGVSIVHVWYVAELKRHISMFGLCILEENYS